VNGFAHAAAAETRPQAVLANNDIVDLKPAGLGDELVIAKIKESPSDFKPGAEDLIALKNASISDLVISEMMTAGKKVR